MKPYIDLHTHQQHPKDDVIAVYNQLLHEETVIPTHLFSAGLHPWYADQLSLEILSAALDKSSTSRNFVAFGETGLDKVCKIPMQIQQDVFELHLNMAVKKKKPLIIHCVKAWDELIEISSNYQTTKTLHGYNGSAELTKRLLQQGFSFSIGKEILNQSSKIHSSVQFIPCSSLFCETDTSDISIKHIYKGLCTILQMQEEDFKGKIFENFARLRSA